MTNNNHTPGPWVLGYYTGTDARYEITTIYGRPAAPTRTVCEIWEPVAEADATLMAAAPELLAALERMLAAHDADVARGVVCAVGNSAAAAQARSAIAKARGL